MGPSSANRIHNVHLLGDYLDGTIVLPGQVFSFNKVVGPRTAERGFLEGQAIVSGVLVPSIGGGVCQTATTVFNAAFEAGLPIIERHNHSFYIDHYPIGRDATVAWGGHDLRLRERPRERDPDQGRATRTRPSRSASTAPTKGGRSWPTTSEQTRFTRAEARSTPSIRRRRRSPCASRRRAARASTSSSTARCSRTGRCCGEDDFETRYTAAEPDAGLRPGAGRRRTRLRPARHRLTR